MEENFILWHNKNMMWTVKLTEEEVSILKDKIESYLKPVEASVKISGPNSINFNRDGDSMERRVI